MHIYYYYNSDNDLKSSTYLDLSHYDLSCSHDFFFLFGSIQTKNLNLTFIESTDQMARETLSSTPSNLYKI